MKLLKKIQSAARRKANFFVERNSKDVTLSEQQRTIDQDGLRDSNLNSTEYSIIRFNEVKH